MVLHRTNAASISSNWVVQRQDSWINHKLISDAKRAVLVFTKLHTSVLQFGNKHTIGSEYVKIILKVTAGLYFVFRLLCMYKKEVAMRNKCVIKLSHLLSHNTQKRASLEPLFK